MSVPTAYYNFADERSKNYAILAALTVLIYDTTLTFPREVSLILKTRFNLVSCLYIIGRYSLLGFLLAPAILGLSVGYFKGLAVGHLAFAPCDPSKTKLREDLDTLYAACGCVFDILSLFITLYHTWDLRQAHKEFFSDGEQSLSSLLIQQGFVRFLVISVWSFELAVLTRLLRPTLTGIDAPIENAISCILICRFTLQLRARGQKEACQDIPISYRDDQRNQNTSISFQTLVSRIEQSVFEDVGEPESPVYHSATLSSS
ncbi:hypothetical protein M422DRAFT_783786 [Sphaerobolus stellatus SS14]|uniref:Unplaced genomic scaffold SPHSTscaffold_168, whole genome shotgun sequence n=1 Tax=Sphaerobolus stellatus (strain SS14) TaxID=990650 RepID=A0A0C9V1J0_SPHS4|nr:hypothetical protein M422DRAFT_783786 [Sphaerobolus stellatus SS14]